MTICPEVVWRWDALYFSLPSFEIMCGFCYRQFETLKGWRIHTSKMHKQDVKPSKQDFRFCARCSHYLRCHSNSRRHRKQRRQNFMSSLVAEGKCGRDKRKKGNIGIALNSVFSFLLFF
uniref:C2H2-type domain-containing protein n=1 Tax=Elaeophora elaphi TaxID=1147741 RepID=A0A0R3RP72_9BILA